MERDYYHKREIIEIFKLDEDFLNNLEAEELIETVELPSSERVFMIDQVERLIVIDNLIRDLNVNVAGCGVILEMRENMVRMQQQFDRVLGILINALRSTSP
ncbi:MAG: chaperone modulator CbpM [Pseudomonadota bacterium]